MVRITRPRWSFPLSAQSEGWMEAEGRDSPRVLLERRLRWLVEVLCGSSVFCWWLLSMGLVAMMLSLYLFIRASLVLSFTAVNREADKHKSKATTWNIRALEQQRKLQSGHEAWISHCVQFKNIQKCENYPEWKKTNKHILKNSHRNVWTKDCRSIHLAE